MSNVLRKFKIGALVLDDPNPSLSVSQVQEVHAKQFPQVRFTTIFNSDGVIVDDATQNSVAPYLLFEYVIPPVSVNG